MTTQTTTTTEETVAPSGPSIGLPEIPPWNPPQGPRLERRRSFEVQSPWPECINPLPPSSDPFRFLALQADSRNKNFASIEEDPSHAYTISRTFGTSDTDPVRSASEPSDDGNDNEGGDNRGSRGGGNSPDPLTHWILPDLLVTKSSPNST